MNFSAHAAKNSFYIILLIIALRNAVSDLKEFAHVLAQDVLHPESPENVSAKTHLDGAGR